MPSPQVLRKPLVLVAEDHEDTRAMFDTLFTMHGYEVVQYADGDSALAAAIRLRPDLLLVDGHLQGLDGVGLASAVRRHEDLRDRPIIFVSGWAGAEHEERARAAGCTHYMLKPVDLDVLVALVGELTSPPVNADVD